jgi:hypothetical protein
MSTNSWLLVAVVASGLSLATAIKAQQAQTAGFQPVVTVLRDGVVADGSGHDGTWNGPHGRQYVAPSSGDDVRDSCTTGLRPPRGCKPLPNHQSPNQ